MNRQHSKTQAELRHRGYNVRITKDCHLLSMEMEVSVGHHINQLATFALKTFRDLGLEVVEIVHNDGSFLHVDNQSLVLVKRELFLEFGETFGSDLDSETFRVSFNVKIGDILGISILFDRRDYQSSLIVVTMGELVSGKNRLDTDLSEQTLIVMTSRASNKQNAVLPSQTFLY